MRPKLFNIILIGMIALAGLMITGGYYYANSQLMAKMGVLSNRLGDESIANDGLDQLKILQGQYTSLAPVASKIDAALPRAKDQSAIILQLQTLASDSGMKLPSASFSNAQGLPTATSQTVKLGDVLALPIAFQLTGSYAQIQTFLTKAEKLNRYTNITSLSIGKAEKGNILNVSINMNVFMKP